MASALDVLGRFTLCSVSLVSLTISRVGRDERARFDDRVELILITRLEFFLKRTFFFLIILDSLQRQPYGLTRSNGAEEGGVIDGDFSPLILAVNFKRAQKLCKQYLLERQSIVEKQTQKNHFAKSQ